MKSGDEGHDPLGVAVAVLGCLVLGCVGAPLGVATLTTIAAGMWGVYVHQ